jgi:hypothetical protein
MKQFRKSDPFAAATRTLLCFLVAGIQLEAGSVPDVDLRDGSGQTVARAAIQFHGQQCRIHLKGWKLDTGRYKLVLRHKDTAIAEEHVFEMEKGGATAIDLLVQVGAGDESMASIIKSRDVQLHIVAEPSGSARASGIVLPWFSPWRDSRR